MQVVIRDGGDAKDNSGRKQRVGCQFGGVSLAGVASHQQNQQRSRNNHDDAHARDRRVRGPNQTRHVTTDTGNQQAQNQHKQNAEDDERHQMVRDGRISKEVPQQQTNGNHGQQSNGSHVFERNVLFRQGNLVSGFTQFRGFQGISDTAQDGANNL